MKIVTVIGARPQFIKAAAVSRKLRKKHREILVHTGQHYDANMSSLFFEELEIPLPDYNLKSGSGSHAEQTADMLVKIEKIVMEENPDFVMVYGDTNSTLAGALAASKLCVPVIHIEAGLRSYNKNMPEEQNRVLTDHISSMLFCPTNTAVNQLVKEGITEGVYQVGDVMYDAVMFYSEKIEDKSRIQYLDSIKGIYKKVPLVDNWYLSTIHRAENTDTPIKIKEILEAFEELELPVIFPVHPRTRKLLEEISSQYCFENTYFIEPIGYLEMLYFTKHAKKVVTDSGGLQKEAYLLDTPCVTLREETEWIETLEGNHNILAHIQKEDILDKIKNTVIHKKQKGNPFGEGNAADKICEKI